MRDEDKPFICYRGPGSIKLVPRGAAGWRALAAWMAAFLVITLVYVIAAAKAHSGQTVAWLTAIDLLVTAVWGAAMFRWMMARSEVIDLNELLALKRERDEQRRRGER